MNSEERQRLDEIEALAKAAETVFQPVVRRVADQIYEDVLYSVQDYLKENLAFNTAQDIASEKRRAQEFLTLAHRTRFSFAVAAACIESRATAAEARVAVLEGLLREAGEVVGALLANKDTFDASSGNQADAYYCLVKGRSVDWNAARALAAKLKAGVGSTQQEPTDG